MSRVVLSEVTEHLDVEHAIREANRVLKKNGRIFIASNIDARSSKVVKTQQSRELFEQALRDNGFDDIRLEKMEGKNDSIGDLSITFIEAVNIKTSSPVQGDIGGISIDLICLSPLLGVF